MIIQEIKVSGIDLNLIRHPGGRLNKPGKINIRRNLSTEHISIIRQHIFYHPVNLLFPQPDTIRTGLIIGWHQLLVFCPEKKGGKFHPVHLLRPARPITQNSPSSSCSCENISCTLSFRICHTHKSAVLIQDMTDNPIDRIGITHSNPIIISKLHLLRYIQFTKSI